MGIFKWGASKESRAPAAEDEGELREELILSMRERSHAEWKADRMAQHPDEKTRFRKTNDQAWIRKNEGSKLLRKNDQGEYEADLLAIDSARDLPREYATDSERSAMIAIGSVLGAVRAGRKLDDALIDEGAALIHVRWVDVHKDDPTTTAEQKLPYSQMGEAEKSAIATT